MPDHPTPFAVYEVGQPYSQTRTTWPETGDYCLRGGTHELRIFLRDPKPAEVQAIAGSSRFAFFEDGPVLLLLYRLGDMPWSDVGCSWHQIARARPEEAGPPPELPTPESRATIWALLVNARTGILEAQSLKSWSPAFSREFHAALDRNRLAPYPGDRAYDAVVAQIYRRYPQSSDMVRHARIQCRGGE